MHAVSECGLRITFPVVVNVAEIVSLVTMVWILHEYFFHINIHLSNCLCSLTQCRHSVNVLILYVSEGVTLF